MSSECSSKKSFPDGPCVCCKSSSIRENNVQASNGEMDMIRLNSALHELGLLSSVTESRKQYLQEKAGGFASGVSSKESASSSSSLSTHHPRKGFCVLHMNSNYVTDFSGASCKPNSSACQQYSRRAMCTENTFFKQVRSRDHHQAPAKKVGGASAGASRGDRFCQAGVVGLRSTTRCRLRFQKPYEVPWMHRLEMNRITSPWVPESDSSSKDSGLGNRSNPGSPEKVAVHESPSCCLVRSRSLDDIEATIHHTDQASSTAAVSVAGHRSELETMSQCMEDLHVN